MKLIAFTLLILIPSVGFGAPTHKPGRSLAVESAVQEEESAEENLSSLPESEQFSKAVEPGAHIFAKGPDILRPHDQTSCNTTADPRSLLGPIRNQSGTGWCFAFTAADMLTQKLGSRVSAAAIASLYYAQKENLNGRQGPLPWSDLKGGYLINAISDAETAGTICSEAEFHSDQLDDEFFRLHPQKVTASSLNQQASAKLSVVLNKLDSYELSGRDPAISCDMTMSAQLMFPGLDIPTVLAILRRAKDSQEAIFWMKKMSCKNPVSIPKNLPHPIEEVASKPGHGRQLLTTIDAKLESGQIVGLTYSLPALLTSSASEEMKAQTVHSSSIIQRKFFDGQCQYLIRDSLGKRCEGYRKCDSDPGNFWITADELDQAGLSIQYFP